MQGPKIKKMPEVSNAPLKDLDFDPYIDNGGTIIAIAGPDFAMIAGDTRLSEGYNILSRNVRKVFPVTDKIVYAASGMHADVQRLLKHMKIESTEYYLKTQKEIAIEQFIRLLSAMMYYRRSFPWYTSSIVAGIDSEGRGAVYSYDVIGSTLRTRYGSAGTGNAMICPILDEAILSKNEAEITREFAFELIQSAFRSCAERDIYTGDSVVAMCISADGIQERTFELRKD